MKSFQTKLKQNWPILAGLLAIFLIIIIAQKSEKSDLIVTFKENSAEQLLSQNSDWQAIEMPSDLNDVEAVRTQGNSKLILSDKKNRAIRLNENTEIKLDNIEVNSFKLNQLNGKAFYEANYSGDYQVEVLNHLILLEKGKMEVSVNNEAKRFHVKAVRGDLIVALNNEERINLKEGDQMTYDPARDNPLSMDKIDDNYDESIWFNWSSSEDKTAETIKEEDVKEPVKEGDVKAEAKTVSPKTTSTPISPNCKPFLSAEVDKKVKGIKLKWSQCTSDDFQTYKLIRENDSTVPVYNQSPAITSLNNQTHNNYFDTLVKSFDTYTYKVCTIQRINRVNCSNSVTIRY